MSELIRSMARASGRPMAWAPTYPPKPYPGTGPAEAPTLPVPFPEAGGMPSAPAPAGWMNGAGRPPEPDYSQAAMESAPGYRQPTPDEGRDATPAVLRAMEAEDPSLFPYNTMNDEDAHGESMASGHPAQDPYYRQTQKGIGGAGSSSFWRIMSDNIKKDIKRREEKKKSGGA